MYILCVILYVRVYDAKPQSYAPIQQLPDNALSRAPLLRAERPSGPAAKLLATPRQENSQEEEEEARHRAVYVAAPSLEVRPSNKKF